MRLLSGPVEGARAVVVTHLEMLDPVAVRYDPDLRGAALQRIATDKARLSRSFYERVGGPWQWVDRLDWDDAQWRGWTDRDTHHLWVMTIDDLEAGYVELEQQGEGVVEIAYLGLLPGGAGSGRGGWLLGRALQEAWALPGTQRVWVHTCDLDAPAALANYQARGLRVFARSVEWRLPEPDTVTP